MTLNAERKDHVQLSFLGGDKAPSMRKASRRENKARVRSIQASLPFKDRRFLPMHGTPKIRADCPVERPCVYVRCRWNLFREDAEHRAGRPGVASVPRDARGWTTPVKGAAGTKRAGTTLRAAWMEFERRCKAMLVWDDDGNVDLDFRPGFGHEADWGSWDALVLHPGEPIEIIGADYGELLAKAHIAQDGRLVLDRRIQWGVACTVIIERVRPVQSCMLDLIEKYQVMSNEQVGDAIGRHRTLVAREVKRAGKKLKDLGVDLRDLTGGL